MKMDKILVTGADGQVGSALLERLADRAIAITHNEINYLDIDSIIPKLEEYAPNAIINPAAYTNVDRAEEETVAAFKINAEAVAKLAEYAFSKNIPLIHFSTDYVFAGDGENAWKESDKTAPLNVYGKSKLAGEEEIKRAASVKSGAKWLNFRTSWVYNETGQNFVNTMLRLGAEREFLGIIDDQKGAPTYAGDIAEYTLKAFEKALEMEQFPSGDYHLCNSEITSWHGFAEEIFKVASINEFNLSVKEVKEIDTEAYPTPAKRPLNSRMDMTKLAYVFGLTMPSWSDALARCLTNKFNNKKDAA